MRPSVLLGVISAARHAIVPSQRLRSSLTASLATSAVQPSRRPLLLVSEADLASVTQHEALIATSGWESMPSPETGTSLWSRGSCYLWRIPDSFLHCNDIDQRWAAAMGSDLAASELIFLSRHAAASGKPCLTVHPIGVAWHASEEELLYHGGRSACLVPPNPRCVYTGLLPPIYVLVCS